MARRLYFKKRFHDAIRAGVKVATLRRWRACRVKPGQIVLAPGVGWLAIESAAEVIWEELTDADAVSDGFACMADLGRAIKRIYPDAGIDGRKWFRVLFRWEGPAATADAPDAGGVGGASGASQGARAAGGAPGAAFPAKKRRRRVSRRRKAQRVAGPRHAGLGRADFAASADPTAGPALKEAREKKLRLARAVRAELDKAVRAQRS
jgi:uncharacterized protein YqfB (UPF0267 family)